MNIIKVTQDEANQEDFNDWLDLALELWPDYSSAEMEVILTNLLHSDRQQGILVRDDNGYALAFMNLSLRHDYVPDATQSPVAYVEGIYVKAEYRNKDVGRMLIQYAEQWAHDLGCIQLALDALLDNPASHEFYAKVGFREVERVVFFIKPVVAPDSEALP
jgi:aminoglycoside 6'-N-acetyltransferase I